MKVHKDLSGYPGTWCPGCGDWAISLSIKKAFTELGLDPSGVFVVFDIGCSGNMNDVLNAYAMHSLHGRSIPPAVGMKLANHKMNVVVIGGDGGIFGEGGNHFLHACRGNHDITVIVHDNSVYGLTTGQVAPTAEKGFVSKSTPEGIIEIPINPLTLAITSGATYVAQAFAGDSKQVTDLIKQGMHHKGFSFINVLQPCVTFNPINTYQYYYDRIYQLPKEHEAGSYEKAVLESFKMNEEKYPLGVVYQAFKPAYHEQVEELSPEKTLVERPMYENWRELIEEFG